MKVRVEYESKPVRHIAIQCPKCKSWFYGCDITDDDIFYDYQIGYAECQCPKCNTSFVGHEDGLEIEEVSYPKIYEDCLEKKVIWE